ncbi:DDRGK domain-containing protein 1 [Intoshia linei]|uniref:DDRGK domain-containing protein 1 n=1 Tax=Intoshia linei TaxID=1819745 RepID=A0A177B9M9_9BILA|nr:DDRGK domain-containing protein 1 [Intoshia linei]
MVSSVDINVYIFLLVSTLTIIVGVYIFIWKKSRKSTNDKSESLIRPQSDEKNELDSEIDFEEFMKNFKGPKKVAEKKWAKILIKKDKHEQLMQRLNERRRKDKEELEAIRLRKIENQTEELNEKLEKEKIDEKIKKKKEEDFNEYLKIKDTFSTLDEGDSENLFDNCSTLNEFIEFVKKKKMIELEELAAHFHLRVDEIINRMKSLLEIDRISGVFDDRGKFIYLTRQDLLNVANFIEERGYVSIKEISQESGRLCLGSIQ